MVCQKCYAQIPDNSAFCPMCGENPNNFQENSGYSQNQQNNSQNQQNNLQNQQYSYQSQSQPQPQQCYPVSKDISCGEWVWSLILSKIPIVNFVFFLILAFSSGPSKSKYNYGKAALILMAVKVVIYVACSFFLFRLFSFISSVGLDAILDIFEDSFGF